MNEKFVNPVVLEKVDPTNSNIMGEMLIIEGNVPSSVPIIALAWGKGKEHVEVIQIELGIWDKLGIGWFSVWKINQTWEACFWNFAIPKKQT